MANLKKNWILLTIIFLVLSACSTGEAPIKENPQVKNLTAFSKLYGYVRFFHPSDEASRIDWSKFAVYGVSQIKAAETEKDLERILKDLFLPIAPTVQIYSSESLPQEKPDIIPIEITGLKPVAWQHFGLRLSERSNIYQSKRINANNEEKSDKLFDPICEPGEIYEADLSAGLNARIPLALYTDTEGTLGKNESYPLEPLINAMDIIDLDSITADEEPVRIANIIISWNVFQHYYPYFDVVGVDWEQVLEKTLNEVLGDTNSIEFYDTIRKMVAKLQDGHGYVYDVPGNKRGGIPVKVDWIEDKVVVVASGSPSFQKGDIFKSINGISGADILLKEEAFVSGSPQLIRHRALNQYGSGSLGSVAEIEIVRNNETIKISHTREADTRGFFFNRFAEFDFPDIEKLPGDIYYVNLSTTDLNEYNKIINKLANAKGIIFDQRWDGKYDRDITRINPVRDIIPYLTENTVTSAQWHIPQVIYPDRKNLSFTQSGWPVEPKEPHFKAKALFINDPFVVSSGETVMGIIEHYELADMVGGPTAGCNGNANFIPLIGGYQIMFTGMKVLKHDGSQHHLLGIKPTHPVTRTIKAVLEGRDEYLDKAIEVLH